MTRRTTTRNRRTVVITALAVAICGTLPFGVGYADEPVDPEPATEPETGELEGAIVAVGPPPVPPATVEPQVAVGLPPVPPAIDEPQVAVGLPPVPPAIDEPQVAIGLPPVPPVAEARQRSRNATASPSEPSAPAGLAATVGAALDLIDDCL